MKRVLLILCSVILLAANSGVLHASTVAVGFSDVNGTNVRRDGAAAQALGFKFKPAKYIDVLELGIYSNGEPIPVYNHDNSSTTANIAILKAGLYDEGGNQLGVVEISNNITVGNSFRWAALDKPVHLNQGQSYYVMAEVGLTKYIWDPIGFFESPEINVLNAAIKKEGELFWLLNAPDVFEAYHIMDNRFLGANFKYEISKVPVPSALLLLGSGCLGLIGFGRKHQIK